MQPMTQRVSLDKLRDLIRTVLMHNSVSESNADVLSDVILAAERDGTWSHGLLRLPGYVSTPKSGWVDGKAEPDISDEGSSFLRANARNGFAQIALARARERLEKKARQSGVAILTICNYHHFASLWPDVEPFAEKGFLAIGCLNSPPRMVAWDSDRKVLGTNPFAFACPRANGPPSVWDQASSVISQGEVLRADRDGDEHHA